MQLVNVRVSISVQEDPGFQLGQGSVPPTYLFTALPQEVLENNEQVFRLGRWGYDYKCSKKWFQWFQEMKQKPSASHLEPKFLELLSSHTFLSFNY